MKVAGFTFLRNGVTNDYPFIESIYSILPLCDKFYIAIDKGEDDTYKRLQDLNEDKIVLIESKWDEEYFKGGLIYSIETNKALSAIPPDFDWCFYLQSDECIHEQYLPTLKTAMAKYCDDKKVECLILKFQHFYGSYSYLGNSRRWYRNEIRIIKNKSYIKSYRDAQGFRTEQGRKLKGKMIKAYVNHYAWIHDTLESPFIRKNKNHDLYYFNRQSQNYVFSPKYYNVDRIKKFKDTHPKVIQDYIKRREKNTYFEPKNVVNQMKWYKKILQFIEDRTGTRLFEFKNYEKI